MLPISISFHRKAQDLAVTCDLNVWRRFKQRYGFREEDRQELKSGIVVVANISVFSNPSGFPPQASDFPDKTARFEIAPAVLELSGKKLAVLISDYEHRPLEAFKTGNYGWLFYCELSRQDQVRFDLDARISFRLPGPIRRDIVDPTLGLFGSHFESNRRRH